MVSRPPETGVYDYLIVGSGTAGCLLANRLSEDRQRRVLLIEAGGKDTYPWIHVPVGYLFCIGNRRTDWCYYTDPNAGLNGRSLLYPRGRTLGGSSSINGMIYMRGQARDYDSWASATGDNEWSWEACLREFLQHEDSHRLDASVGVATEDKDGRRIAPDGFHASGGEWRVERQRLRWEILEAYREAAVQSGIPRSSDFNTGDNEGVGYFEVNQRHGWRWSAAKAFLNPVKTRKNLTILTGAMVTRLLFESDNGLRCAGVEVHHSGGEIRPVRARDVILSAGAIGTPTLLQLSGIGPGDHLRKTGVQVRLDLAGVGKNLQDHLQLRIPYRVHGVETLNQMASSLFGKAKMAFDYALFRRGPLSMAPSQLGIFTRSDPGRSHPNIQFHVQPLSLDSFGEPLHSFPGITASVCNLNPTSRGSVLIKSNDAADAPTINPNYLATQQDLQVAADSIRAARSIAIQPALQRYQPQELKPGPEITNDEDLASASRDIGTTIFHPVGTAKMGRKEDPMAVVDSHLRVRGVDGLRVVDASVMPTITSGNTNSPTLMIAEKAANWIAKDY